MSVQEHPRANNRRRSQRPSRRPARRPAATAAVLLAALLATAAVLTASLAACGGSGHPAAAHAANTANAAPSSTAPAAQDATGAAELVISDFGYRPADLTVRPGQRVIVVNKDSTPHTVTATTGHAFDTGPVPAGGSTTFTAPAKPGSYPYICSIHQFMHGTLTVR